MPWLWARREGEGMCHEYIDELLSNILLLLLFGPKPVKKSCSGSVDGMWINVYLIARAISTNMHAAWATWLNWTSLLSIKTVTTFIVLIVPCFEASRQLLFCFRLSEQLMIRGLTILLQFCDTPGKGKESHHVWADSSIDCSGSNRTDLHLVLKLRLDSCAWEGRGVRWGQKEQGNESHFWSAARSGSFRFWS